MKFKIGDRVKFLDEQGGGVVSRIVSPTLVEVTTAAGFSFPYAVKSLIPVKEESISERLFNQDVEETKDIEIEQDDHDGEPNAHSDALTVFPSQKKKENYACKLAFVPQEQRWLITGDMDVYFVNFSDADIFFVLYTAVEQGFGKVVSAKVKAFSRFYIGEVSREDIGDWEKLVVQAFVSYEKAEALPAPVDVEVKIRGSRFYRETSYLKQDFMHEKAVFFDLFKIANLPLMHTPASMPGKDVEPVKKTIKQAERNDEILKHIVSEGKAVVDMHIWKLVDDEMNMSAHQKLLTQLDYFNKCLDSALEHHLHKVIFIHGVGTGKLKEEIKAILDDKELRHKPASMAEYGVGATEVELPLYGRR